MKADFIGTCCWDNVYIVPQYPVENKKIRAVHNYSQSGGFATNAAKTCAYLGGNTTLYTAIGDTHYSDELNSDFQIPNLTVKDCAPQDYTLHSSSILINQENGSRTIISSKKDNALNSLKGKIDIQGDILFIDGFFIDSAIDAIKQAKRKNIPVVFDADKWRNDRYLEFFEDIDFIIAGDEFFPPNCSSQNDVITFLQMKVKGPFAITNGSHDIIFTDDQGIKHMAVPQIECVDSLGAGDVFHGAFCYYIMKTDFVTSLENSAKVASQFCTDYGFSSLR